MRDVASFLKEHPPFDELDAATVARLAQRARRERFPAGTTIFEQGAEPPGALRVVCDGAVELVDHGRVVDLLGEGELFGHPSMVAAMLTGLQARHTRTRPASRYRRRMYSRCSQGRRDQVTQLGAGTEADDHADPKSLGPLARHHLRDAFRAVVSVQRNLDRGLHWNA